MYLEFFKFKKDPFDITPDPDFLFLSPSHKEASASIFYGIQARKGFVALTGEVGVGKTTVLRSYVEGSDPEKIRIVYIFNSAISFDKLLKQICSDLGVQTAGEDQAETVDILFRYLIEEYRKDHNVVLIIDEAQNMPAETLERLRVLTNLETSQDKLIQIIIAGQPELETKLELSELRHLKQRIAIRSRIEALTADESIAYIHHRLMKASSFHNPVFTKNAMKLIIKQAKGVPRTINILCDNALVTAFGYLRKPVDEKIVKEVLRDFRGKYARSGFSWKMVWAPALVACFAFAVFVSVNVLSRFHRAKVADPSSAKVVAGRSAVVNPGKKGQQAAKSNSTPAPGRKQLITKKAPEGKTGSAGAVKPGAKPAVKSTPAPGRKQLITKKAPEGKTGSAGAPIQPAASSRTKSASGAGALGNLSTPAKAAQPNKPLALAPSQTQKPSPPVVVRKGDNVSKLLLGVYGKVDDNMLKSFKDLNPQVKDINKLSVGEKIFLPQLQPDKP